jgi:hypothetical protein
MFGMEEERRLSPRVCVPYPARLWRTDMDGRVSKEDTRVDNLSSGGLYLRSTHPIENGANIFLAVRLSVASPPRNPPALRLAAQGRVVRVDPMTDGSCGLAIEFTRRRVL